MKLAAAFAAAYLGFALLALSLPRHWRDVTGSSGPPVRRRTSQRVAGYVALALALAIAFWRDGAAFGSVLGMLLLTTSAVAVSLTLSWLPRMLAPLSRAGAKLTGRDSARLNPRRASRRSDTR